MNIGEANGRNTYRSAIFVKNIPTDLPNGSFRTAERNRAPTTMVRTSKFRRMLWAIAVLSVMVRGRSRMVRQ